MEFTDTSANPSMWMKWKKSCPLCFIDPDVSRLNKKIGSNAIVEITNGVLEGSQMIVEKGRYEFILYISGQTPRSEKAVEDLKRLFKTKLKRQYSLEVIDVMKSPQSTRKYDIIATPTLVKVSPPPEKRFIGDFGKSQFFKLL